VAFTNFVIQKRDRQTNKQINLIKNKLQSRYARLWLGRPPYATPLADRPSRLYQPAAGLRLPPAACACPPTVAGPSVRLRKPRPVATHWDNPIIIYRSNYFLRHCAKSDPHQTCPMWAQGNPPSHPLIPLLFHFSTFYSIF